MDIALSVVSQAVFAFFATLAFAVIFEVSRRDLIWCGLSGGLGQTVYALMKVLGADMLIQYAAAAIVVAWTSRFLAIRRRTPVTVYLVAGIIPLVPGAGFYYTMYNIIAHRNSEALTAAIDTFKAAGAISVGIIFVLALPAGLCGARRRKKAV